MRIPQPDRLRTRPPSQLRLGAGRIEDLHRTRGLTPRAPRMNAHCERVIGTIRREALDHVLILGESHARKVLTDYQDHYNGHRPHRSRQQLPSSATEQPAIVHALDDRSLLRTRVLGGIINEYRYAA
ncbi:integrase core domain-containing protein [Streptomyces sp. NBC_01363]|uniref:integrase core domain-containing protein n=1 Tax=Streptomyces sp. NBC_01363 TaxID=2903840 RepID=UPI002B1E5895|nr:integrase core domain-containing protein [Streptomyces sp. NBC_01363]